MRPPRICFVGGIYHVVVRCNNREFFFCGDEDFSLFLKVLFRAKSLYRVRVYAYTLTNNHVHLLVATPEKANLSNFMQYLNGQFSRSYNLRHGKTGRFWGGRFHSTVIEESSQFFNTMLYIECNMVRCGAVRNPAEWKWSSYQAHAMGKDDPLLDLGEHYLNLAATSEERQKIYRDMTETYLQEKGLLFQPQLSRGIFVGTATFVENLIDKYGKILTYFHNRSFFEFSPATFSLCRTAPSG